MNENEIINQYQPLINHEVSRFIRRCSMPTTSREDLMQEATLAFLLHIRTHEPADYGKCKLSLQNAMYNAVRRDYPLYVPHGVFKREMSKGLWMVNIDTIADTPAMSYNSIEDWETVTAMEDRLTPSEKKLMRLKLDGKTSKDAGEIMGLSSVQVCRMLKRMRLYI